MGLYIFSADTVFSLQLVESVDAAFVGMEGKCVLMQFDRDRQMFIEDVG